MRDRISITNTTAMPMYVGSDMIAPGDTRDFWADQVPEHYRPQTAPAPAPTEAELAEAERLRLEAEEKAKAEALEAAGKKIAELLANTVENITGSFPVLSDDEIAALQTAEAAKGDDARKTLIEALAKETAARAIRNSGQ